MNGTARMSEIRTKFRTVFQTERSDFGHLLYLKTRLVCISDTGENLQFWNIWISDGCLKTGQKVQFWETSLDCFIWKKSRLVLKTGWPKIWKLDVRFLDIYCITLGFLIDPCIFKENQLEQAKQTKFTYNITSFKVILYFYISALS